MNTEKKLCLITAGLALTIALIFAVPVIGPVSSVDIPLTTSPINQSSLSAAAAPPETTINLDGTPGSNNWFTSDVTVTFTVSGYEPEFETSYSFDETNWFTYDGPFVISTEGITTLYYYSTDSVGDIEETNSKDIQIDKNAPELFLETENIPGKGTLVTIVAIEDVSLLVDVGYTLVDGGRWDRYQNPILLTEEGTQPFYYRASDLAGNTVSKLDYVDVVILPVAVELDLTYTGDLSGVYSDPVHLEAALTDVSTGMPIPERLVMFTIGTQTASAMTNTEGIASTDMILNQPAGAYDLVTSFDSEDEYLSVSTTHEFIITKEQALTYYSGFTIFEESDSSTTFMATVFDQNDGYFGDLSNAFVTFTLYQSSDPDTPLYVTDPIAVEPTDMAGIGVATVEIPSLPADQYLVIVSLSPESNLYYEGPDSDAATITVYEPWYGKAMGYGWIKDADGNKGFVVFYIEYSCRGTLKGYIQYSIKIGNYLYYFKTTDITGFTVEGNHAFFEATTVIFQYNLETNENVQLDGTFRLRIDAWDINKRCRTDIFQMRIFDERGLVVYEIGFNPQDETIWVKVMISPKRYRYHHQFHHFHFHHYHHHHHHHHHH